MTTVMENVGENGTHHAALTRLVFLALESTFTIFPWIEVSDVMGMLGHDEGIHFKEIQWIVSTLVISHALIK